jgi:hypothetical protein
MHEAAEEFIEQFKWNGEFQNKTVSNGMYFYVVKVTRNKQTEVFKNSLCVLK